MHLPQSLANFPKVAAAPSPRSSQNAASASIFSRFFSFASFANDWGCIYSSARISLRNAGLFLNARNGVGHQVNLVEEIKNDLLHHLVFGSSLY